MPNIVSLTESLSITQLAILWIKMDHELKTVFLLKLLENKSIPALKRLPPFIPPTAKTEPTLQPF
jgi:hypothetical protein